MKLITEHGQLPLPDDLEIAVEQHNPFFSDEGASSVPVTIPATQQALSVLGRPERVGSTSRLRRMAATMSEGVFIKNGQLLLESASADEGITCSFLLAESEFYTQFKEKNLRDIFADKVRQEWQDIEALYIYLVKLYRDEATDDFILCPVAVDYDSEAGSYRVNNAPLAGGHLEYLSRYIPDGEDSILVPDGYGIAPFLYLHRLIDLLFSLSGYTVGLNPFRTDTALKRIIVLHNVSDVICTGKIDYSDLVPDMTVSDFLEWLHDKFLAAVSIDPERKQADVYLLQDVLSNAVADMDLSGKIDGHVTITFNDTSRVVLKADTSLEGAAPAAETMDDFFMTNEFVLDAVSGDIDTENINKAVCARIRATGDYYTYSDISQEDKNGRRRLGSGYFNYDKKNSESSEEFSPKDPLPPMVYVNGVLMPYIGTRVHRHTQVNGEKEDADGQKIIIAYDRGAFSQEDNYRLATTQKYDAHGTEWTEYSLTPDDLYLRFFSLYNGLLRGGKEELSGHLVLSPQELLSADIMRHKMFKGQHLLITGLAYSLRNRKIQFGETSFLILKNLSDPDTRPAFQELKFYWKLNRSEVDDRFDYLQSHYGGPHGGGSYRMEYPDGVVYPSGAPTYAGQIGYKQSVTVHFTITDDMLGTTVYEADETLEIWYEAAAL